MKRRSFLYQSGWAALPIFLQGKSIRVLSKSKILNALDPNSDRVLVLVQLHGGNDGLNTLIPLDQYDALSQVRQNILIPENKILDLGNTNGFHPSMSKMKELWEEGFLGVVQNVGYPDQNRSHFRSKDIWTSASDSDELVSSGWLGRAMDLDYPDFPQGYPNVQTPDPIAISIGHLVSETCQGVGANFSYALNNPEALSQLGDPLDSEVDNSCYGQELSFIKSAIQRSNAYAGTVSQAYEKGLNTVDYEVSDTRTGGLYRELQIVAKLISGGLKTRVYVVSAGGYDTHADQVLDGDVCNGIHAELLTELSEAIHLFQKDMTNQGLDERVLGMTFSEFGRRIKSNASLGTDHGTAAPLFLFGACVQANILGDNPDISVDVPSNAGVPMQYDFRSVYGSVLTDWMGMNRSVVESLLKPNFQNLPILKACQSPVSSEDVSYFKQNCYLYPNPVLDELNIRLMSRVEAKAEVEIYGTIGDRLFHKSGWQLYNGQNTLQFSVSNLRSGLYFIRIALSNGLSLTKSFKKI